MKPDLTGYAGSEKSHFFQAEQKERTGTVNSVFFQASYIVPGRSFVGPGLPSGFYEVLMIFSTQKRRGKN